jgi:hypothetical protein
MIKGERAHNFSSHSTPAATFARGLLMSQESKVTLCQPMVNTKQDFQVCVLNTLLTQMYWRYYGMR